MNDFDHLWDYNQPEVTEQKFNIVLKRYNINELSNEKAELLTQIARTQGLQGKFIEAHRTLDEVSSLPPTKDFARARIRYLLERGRVYNSSGSPELAVPLFLEAWETAFGEDEHDFAVDAAHMLGIAEADPDTRMQWNLRALSHAEAHEQAKRWLGSLYNNIGWSLVDAGNLEQAYGMFKRALSFREEQGDAEDIRIAKWSIGKTLRLMGRIQEALEIQELLYHEAIRFNGPSGYMNEEIAECLLGLGRKEESRLYFQNAYNLLSKDLWLANNEAGRLQRLCELAANT